ncbi:MAG: DUF4348 domain-containing protein, partial [Bacteroides sp.]|nr:DUF4348 domain-containing protein [Bacteroides sp.]
MKRTLTGLLILLVLSACGNENAKKNRGEGTLDDSYMDTSLIDTEEEEENEEEEEEVAWTDGSFESFIYNFVTYENLQFRRIKFPLPYYQPDTVVRIEKSEWEFDKL